MPPNASARFIMTGASAFHHPQMAGSAIFKNLAVASNKYQIVSSSCGRENAIGGITKPDKLAGRRQSLCVNRSFHETLKLQHAIIAIERCQLDRASSTHSQIGDLPSGYRTDVNAV